MASLGCGTSNGATDDATDDDDDDDAAARGGALVSVDVGIVWVDTGDELLGSS